MTINIYDVKTFQIKSILNPNIEKYVKCISLNKGTSKELAAYYEGEILIFDLKKEIVIEKFKCSEPKQIEFNKDNQLSIVLINGDLQYLDLYKKKIEDVKILGKAILSRWYPFDVNISYLIYFLFYLKSQQKLLMLIIKEKLF